MAKSFAKPFYKSKQWQDVRAMALARDNHLCAKCGAPAEEVHHIIHLTEENIHDPMVSMNLNNLQSLCKDCHFKEHLEDKANGMREIKYEYAFDNNGMLVKKTPH